MSDGRDACSGVDLRRYRPEDQDAVVAINRWGLAAAGVPVDVDVYAGDLADPDAVEATYLTGRSVLLVIEAVGGDLVGMGGLRPAGPDDPDTGEITRMRILPAHQGHGHGRAVLAALEAHAHAFGYRRVVLLTGPDQHPAVDLYRSAGYVDERHVDVDGLPGVYLTKDLEPGAVT